MYPVPFWKGTKDIQWKKIIFLTDGVGTIAYVYAKKWPLTYTSHRMQKLKRILGAGVKRKTIKLLEENVGRDIHNLW